MSLNRYRVLSIGLCIWLAALASSPARAQVEASAVTAGAIITTLEQAINALNGVLSTAGNEVRSAGASLAGNAQNVLSDLKTSVGSNLDRSVGALQGMQKQLAEDALLLTRQLNQAAADIANKTGEQARQTVWEADMTAYNTSYSLPCRDQKPRVLFSIPAEVRRGTNVPEVTLRGNFLDIGAPPAVSVDGRPAALIARQRNELRIQIPAEVMNSANEPRSVRLKIETKELSRTNLWLFCPERIVPAPVEQAVVLRPELQYKVKGVISGTYDKYESWSKAFEFHKEDGDCEASYDVTQQWCAPEGYELVPANPIEISKHSANCNSSISDAALAGARCVTVPAHLGGCGYDNIINFLGARIRNCKGRGWVHYTITLNARKPIPTTLDPFEFIASSPDGKQRSFSFTHPAASQNLPSRKWEFQAAVETLEGGKLLRSVKAGTANPNPAGINTKLGDGVVFVNVE